MKTSQYENLRKKPLLTDTRFFKEFIRDSKIEYAKALVLWELSRTGGFITPRPLLLNDRTIEYERLGYTECLRDGYLRYMKSNAPDEGDLETFFIAGRILARIHLNLVLDNLRRWEPPESFWRSMDKMKCAREFEKFCLDSPQAFLHCDYSFANIYINRERCFPRLVLFDPSPNYHTTFYPDSYGSVYVDIGVLFSNINGRVPLVNYPGMKWKRLNSIKRAFLAGYGDVSKSMIDLKWAERFGYAVAESYFRYSSRLALISAASIYCVYNPLKGNALRSFQ